jgi:hypothetical protein
MISIQSLEENEFVRNLTKKSIPGAFNLWIGAKRTGSGLLDFELENESPFYIVIDWKVSQTILEENSILFICS